MLLGSVEVTPEESISDRISLLVTFINISIDHGGCVHISA